MTSAVWYLYTLWSTDGRKMYVGITSQDPPERRIVQHAQRTWWPHVDSTRTDIKVMNRGSPISKTEAETIERRAIQADGGTLANNEWNGGRGRMFENHLEAGGTLHTWEPTRIVLTPAGGLGEPWSSTFGDRIIAGLLSAGVSISAVVFVAALINDLTK